MKLATLFIFMILLTACNSESPILTPAEIVATQAPPTATLIPSSATPIPPTPTHIPLASIDLDTVLVRPSGLVREENRQLAIFERAPQSDNSIELNFVLEHRAITVLLHLFENSTSRELAYAVVVDELGSSPQTITTIGEKATLAWLEFDLFGEMLNMPSLAWVRCGAVVFTRLFGDSKPDLLLEYDAVLDKSIVEKVC